jgi:hypothetical protein
MTLYKCIYEKENEMRLTVNQLRRIIKEEVTRTLGEARGAINEMTLPEMYEQFISALEAELSDPDTQETALAGLRRILGVKVSDELLAREKAAREEKKAKGEKFNI